MADCHIGILQQLGELTWTILQPGDKAITGSELDAMTDGQLDQAVEHISVYARVSPENKIRIVKAWQRKGQVVSMTGDGTDVDISGYCEYIIEQHDDERGDSVLHQCFVVGVKLYIRSTRIDVYKRQVFYSWFAKVEKSFQTEDSYK